MAPPDSPRNIAMPEIPDPILLEVVGNYLVSTCEEMGVAMMRTSYSTMFNEARDFSCVIFDACGEMIAQGGGSIVNIASESGLNGEPGLSAAEKVWAWNSFEVLAFKTGNPDHPVNAVPPRATAHCGLRWVPPCDPEAFAPALRRHLDDHGFPMVEITPETDYMMATRLDPDNPWVRWAVASIDATTGRETAVLPNLGGSLPNDVFSEVLGLPTVWVPHSYASCSQHAPNEHILEATTRQALELMTGLYWDLGEPGTPTGTKT